MDWLKAFGKSLSFLITTYLAERRARKPKKPKRLDVPDNIWESSARRAEALRPEPRDGHAEYEPEDGDG